MTDATYPPLVFTFEADRDYTLPALHKKSVRADGKEYPAPGEVIDMALAVLGKSLMLEDDFEFMAQFGPSVETLRNLSRESLWAIRRTLIDFTRHHQKARREGDGLSITYVVPIEPAGEGYKDMPDFMEDNNLIELSERRTQREAND